MLNTIGSDIDVRATFVAEELILHKVYDNARCDLYLSEKIIRRMCGWGMFGLQYFYDEDRQEELPFPQAQIDLVNGLIRDKLQECYLSAKQIVEKNETLLRKLIPVLIEKRSVDKAKLEPILEELGGLAE